MDAEVQIAAARVVDANGTALALIERMTIGGGIRVIEGEEHQHPTFERFHVRMLSPDRMIADQLLEAETYDAAVDLAMTYAAKRIEHAARVDQLAIDLRMS